MTKTIDLFGRQIRVPIKAKYVFQDDNGMCWWSVETPEPGQYTWKFPKGDFGIIKWKQWRTLLKEV